MVGKQLKSDKNSIKWGLIIGIFLVLFAGPVLAEEVSFGQTENSSTLSNTLTPYSSTSVWQPLNDKNTPILGVAKKLKFWVKETTDTSSRNIQFYLKYEDRLISDDSIVLDGSYWLSSVITIAKGTDLQQEVDIADRLFEAPLEGRYRLFWFSYEVLTGAGSLKARGSNTDIYGYGPCLKYDCGALVNGYFRIAGEFSFYPGMPPPPARVFGISPESGSTITNLEDEFVVGWEGLPDPNENIYNIILSFIEPVVAITEGSILFSPEEASGEKSFKFADFGFQKNGTFKLYAHTGIFFGLTTYPLWFPVSPPYSITINIEEYPGYFQMPEFYDWYSENAMFDEPTALFSAITGFISPLYNKIGEFGDQVSTFLDTDEAYSYGYSLGLIFPTFRHYINEIEVFFGGFPIITIFLVILILFLAIFIFRLILKFIPGLG